MLMRFEGEESASVAWSPEAWNVLASAWKAPPDEFGCVVLARDGGQADVYTGGIETPARSIVINHFGGDAIMQLIVEFAEVTDAVIVGPGLPSCRTRPNQHIPEGLAEFGEPIYVSSGPDLSRAIRSV